MSTVKERLEDAADISRWRAQSAPDPRKFDPKHRARLALYEDDFPTRAERGTKQNRFIEPKGK